MAHVLEGRNRTSQGLVMNLLEQAYDETDDGFNLFRL
jgi:hypothetical protein